MSDRENRDNIFYNMFNFEKPDDEDHEPTTTESKEESNESASDESTTTESASDESTTTASKELQRGSLYLNINFDIDNFICLSLDCLLRKEKPLPRYYRVMNNIFSP